MTGAGCTAHQEKSHQMTTPLSSVTCPRRREAKCGVQGAWRTRRRVTSAKYKIQGEEEIRVPVPLQLDL